MSSRWGAVLHEQLAVGWQRWALRAAALGSLLVALAATGFGSTVGSATAATLIVAGALVAALIPDSPAPLIVIVAIVWRWLAVTRNPLDWRVNLVAAGLIVGHAACALLAGLPAGASLPCDVVRRWLVRVAIVTLASIACWGFGLAVDGRSPVTSSVLSAAALVLVGAVVAGLVTASLTDRPPASDRERR